MAMRDSVALTQETHRQVMESKGRQPQSLHSLDPTLTQRGMRHWTVERIEAAHAEEPIWERVASGQTLMEIARGLGVSRAWLAHWIRSDPHRRAMVAAARVEAAESFDELAELRIMDASDPLELAKAKELATHYRWRSRVLDPQQYGDKMTVATAADEIIRGLLERE